MLVLSLKTADNLYNQYNFEATRGKRTKQEQRQKYGTARHLQTIFTTRQEETQ